MTALGLVVVALGAAAGLAWLHRARGHLMSATESPSRPDSHAVAGRHPYTYTP